MHAPRSLLPPWAQQLPIQQQGVLMMALRGPDGVAKMHPCKAIVRAYRASVILGAYSGRLLDRRDSNDSFMAPKLAYSEGSDWRGAVRAYFDSIDSLPHHFHLHLMHAAEVLGYKHPDGNARHRWFSFYGGCCDDMHLKEETEAEMDERLNDWAQEGWA